MKTRKMVKPKWTPGMGEDTDMEPVSMERSPGEMKKELEQRWVTLKGERSTWYPHWQELARQIRPRGNRFLAEDANKGWGLNEFIINSTPTFAARTLAAGMMSATSSPSRPWFRLTTPRLGLDEVQSVKEWLRLVEDVFRIAMARSNTYNAFAEVHSDLAVPGTAVLYVEADEHQVLRCYVLPIGSYTLACDASGRVDTLFHEMQMTVRQLVERFTLDNVSTNVATLYKNDKYETWVKVLHVVIPNEDYQEGAAGMAGKKYCSIWMEQGGDADKLLRCSGYDKQPFMAPRWAVTGEDVYGRSPAMDVLGDCKALQVLELSLAKLVEKSVNPPMVAPAGVEQWEASLLPGSVTHVPEGSAHSYAPAQVVAPASIAECRQAIAEITQRIRQGFFADLWLMLSEATGKMTATEVLERREEKLLQLGSVLERLSNELFDGFFEILFGILQDRGEIPPAPPELQGTELRVEYLNVMATAQKLQGAIGVEKLSGFVAQLAPINPDSLDVIDFDQAIQELGGMYGVPPVMVRPDDAIDNIRKARAQAQQKAAALAQAQQAAETTKTLGQTPLGTEQDPNALGAMMKSLGAA